MSIASSATAGAVAPPGRAAAPFLAATLVTLMAAAAAPTPLYRLYQQSWGFSPAMLTVVFAVYALSLLAVLLTAGSLSDHVGRRPVIFAALLLEILGMGLFVAAESPSMLIAARIVQGLATGAATSALAAALLDSARRHGPLINSLVTPVGMALGALGTSALAELAPWPLHLVYILLAGLFVVQAAALWLLPEMTAPRPGAWASLRPCVAVPPQARAAFLRLSPLNVAIWALGGFFMSLAPSLVREATGAAASLAGGAVVATFTGAGALSILALRHRPARTALLSGAILLLAGVAVLAGGVHLAALPLFLAGALLAGLGWGASFLGILRALLPLAGAEERAGLVSAYYIQGYVALGAPAIAAGMLGRWLGLVVATDIYTAVLLSLAGMGLALVVLDGRGGQELHP
ncbi:MFS transporter [Rhodovastum atsumiense]|uniref:MFS transporter n=1 Tax=Rhodovastum atsumiense TaxID=504468 RepID=A0A5M6IND6_9PROT|nr:MFS transporter [Rhodovastum atsumiense]KAA5609068.1 MFS transporter [Rhodovastum atsumiense]CAH2602181.1 MFS transporter [Rhodovastum atsumiense]